MAEIGRIRALILKGQSDAEILAALRRDQMASNDAAGDRPESMLRALAQTMRRAVTHECPVAAHEVLPQLQLFRLLWEELVASGDVDKVDAVVLKMLLEVAPAESVSQAYMSLEEDLKLLSTSAKGMPREAKQARVAAESRYIRKVKGHKVICLAHAGAVVAEATRLMFDVVGEEARYQELFPSKVLQTCVGVIAMPRGTWTEMLQEAGVIDGSMTLAKLRA